METNNNNQQPGQLSDKQIQDNKYTEERQKETKGQTHNTTLAAGNIGTAVTAQVDPHNNSGLANTGTNISYEGATAPGSGGSMGTGYTSGKTGDDPKIRTNTDFVQGEVGKHYDKAEGDDTNKEGTADVSE